jgi:hypothetical protein
LIFPRSKNSSHHLKSKENKVRVGKQNRVLPDAVSVPTLKVNSAPQRKPLLWQPGLFSPSRSQWEAGAKFVISKGNEIPWRMSGGYGRGLWIAHLSLSSWYELEIYDRGTNFALYSCALYEEKIKRGLSTVHVLWTKEICFHGEPEAETAFKRALEACTQHYQE